MVADKKHGSAARHYVLLLAACLLLFAPPPIQDNRLFDQFWNLGHIVIFVPITVLLWNKITHLRLALAWRVSLCLLLVMVIGGFIEIMQSAFDYRQSELIDLLGDLAGACVTLTWLVRRNKKTALWFSAFSIILLVLCISPLFSTAWDLSAQQQAFPRLGSFESQAELQRWRGSQVDMRLSSEHVSHGNHALRLDFSPGPYPRISLLHTPVDWSAYTSLQLKAFNPHKHTLMLSVRINDKLSSTNKKHRGRFEKAYPLAPGNNQLYIPLDQLKREQSAMQLQLNDIKQFTLYLTRPGSAVTLYLDDIRLN